MKYAGSVERWIGWSNFSGGEVHGKIDGNNIENRQRSVSGSDDPLELHIKLNPGEHWKAMVQEAGTEIGRLPPEAFAP